MTHLQASPKSDIRGTITCQKFGGKNSLNPRKLQGGGGGREEVVGEGRTRWWGKCDLELWVKK